MFSTDFLKALVERALKTFVQALIATWGANTTDIIHSDWADNLSIAGSAAILSVLMSLASSGFGNAGPSIAGETVNSAVVAEKAETSSSTTTTPVVAGPGAPTVDPNLTEGEPVTVSAADDTEKNSPVEDVTPTSDYNDPTPAPVDTDHTIVESEPDADPQTGEDVVPEPSEPSLNPVEPIEDPTPAPVVDPAEGDTEPAVDPAPQGDEVTQPAVEESAQTTTPSEKLA